MESTEFKHQFANSDEKIKELISNVWVKLLNLDFISNDDDFYNVGGDSLLYIRMMYDITQVGIEYDLGTFSYPRTINKLVLEVKYLEHSLKTEHNYKDEFSLLTPWQYMWLANQQVGTEHYGNLFRFFEIEQDYNFDIQTFKKALLQLMNYHEALTTRLIKKEGEIYQINKRIDLDEIPFEEVDFSDDYSKDKTLLLENSAAQFQRSLDPFKGKMCQFVYYNLGFEKSGRLLIIIHHFVCDGFSMFLIIQDLFSIYTQMISDTTVELPNKTSTLSEYVKELENFSKATELKQESDYWCTIPLDKINKVPIDFEGNENKNIGSSFKSYSTTLGINETTFILHQLPKNTNSSVFEFLLVAFAKWYEDWTKSTFLYIGFVNHSRVSAFSNIDLSRTVGAIASNQYLVLNLDHNTSVQERIISTKKQLHRNPLQNVCFHHLKYYSKSSLADVLQTLPPPLIGLYYGGSNDVYSSNEPGFIKNASEKAGPTYDTKIIEECFLYFAVDIINNQLILSCRYSENLYLPSTITKLVRQLKNVMKKLTESLKLSEIHITYEINS